MAFSLPLHSIPLSYLYVHLEDGLHDSWLSTELAGIHGSASCGNNLASTTMDCISVQCHIMEIESNSSHILFTDHSLQDEHPDINGYLTVPKVFHIQVTIAHLFGHPLETGPHTVLDLVEVLNPL